MKVNDSFSKSHLPPWETTAPPQLSPLPLPSQSTYPHFFFIPHSTFIPQVLLFHSPLSSLTDIFPSSFFLPPLPSLPISHSLTFLSPFRNFLLRCLCSLSLFLSHTHLDTYSHTERCSLYHHPSHLHYQHILLNVPTISKLFLPLLL